MRPSKAEARAFARRVFLAECAKAHVPPDAPGFSLQPALPPNRGYRELIDRYAEVRTAVRWEIGTWLREHGLLSVRCPRCLGRKCGICTSPCPCKWARGETQRLIYATPLPPLAPGSTRVFEEGTTRTEKKPKPAKKFTGPCPDCGKEAGTFRAKMHIGKGPCDYARRWKELRELGFIEWRQLPAQDGTNGIAGRFHDGVVFMGAKMDPHRTWARVWFLALVEALRVVLNPVEQHFKIMSFGPELGRFSVLGALAAGTSEWLGARSREVFMADTVRVGAHMFADVLLGPETDAGQAMRLAQEIGARSTNVLVEQLRAHVQTSELQAFMGLGLVRGIGLVKDPGEARARVRAVLRKQAPELLSVVCPVCVEELMRLVRLTGKHGGKPEDARLALGVVTECRVCEGTLRIAVDEATTLRPIRFADWLKAVHASPRTRTHRG